jgi:peptidyl-prolyl cis-trans isomerase SurA
MSDGLSIRMGRAMDAVCLCILRLLPKARWGGASANRRRGAKAPSLSMKPIFGTTEVVPLRMSTSCSRFSATWACLWVLLICVVIGGAQAPAAGTPVMLDKVVAVVNNHAILESDLGDEIRLSVLDPNRGGLGVLTRQQALEQLIARALIQQQIRQEDESAAEPSQKEVDARLSEIRRESPACARRNCSTDEGWKAFLAGHGLTAARVQSYLRFRLEILRFIEQRFREGIQITPQEIEKYYHDTLLPQYTQGQDVPSLEKVSPRIQEILLQQQVNVMFDEWLDNLRKQGDVEVLDPALSTPDAQANAGKGDGSR